MLGRILFKPLILSDSVSCLLNRPNTSKEIMINVGTCVISLFTLINTPSAQACALFNGLHPVTCTKCARVHVLLEMFTLLTIYC